ncbi:hypothetical protein BDA96_10G020500 [Sorghum bicolor]|uniref:Pectinesterase inhibitor domain-containing protein n=2 Tax=Sorghum bicolor TaxID=4558 RepID=A0A921Q138_SORBI|nr:hypothetical protein BDA96_10G020300 [Sorghum bicolor]KAG0512512.1 hypothetical protein BDA96_10G020500 [Sorghum bicolor]KXG19178.1 hypothetical protein SORBI_3010G017700 [Sorghum bicolor]
MKQHQLLLVVVVVAGSCLWLQSTTAAGEPSPLVANLPSSPVMRDFIHSRCETVQRPESAAGCYSLLLPYAASINGSAIRAARAAITAMVSELGAYAADLRKVGGTVSPQYDLSSCMQVAQEGTDGCKEPLAKLARLEEEEKKVVTQQDQDVADVKKWLGNIIAKSSQCRLFDSYGVGQVGVDMPRQGMVSSSIDASSALVNDITMAAQAQHQQQQQPADAAAARDFIHSLCNATCPVPVCVRECFNLLAPYAVSINGSNTRAVRSGVTVVVAELQALAKSAIDFNKTNGQDYELGPCIQVIQEAAKGGEAELQLNAADDQHFSKWYQDAKNKIQKCDYDIADVPRSQVVLNAFAALAGIVSGGGAAGTPK